MKRNEHLLRKAMIQSHAKEIALGVANEGIAFATSEGEEEERITGDIQKCLFYKYGITNEQLDTGFYMYYFSSKTEEEVAQIFIQSQAQIIANKVISYEYVISMPNPNVIPRLRFLEEVDEYLEKEFKIIHRRFDAERNIYFLASSDEDKIIKKAHAQIDEEEKAERQEEVFRRMIRDFLN